jgi:hypothetical protein
LVISVSCGIGGNPGCLLNGHDVARFRWNQRQLPIRLADPWSRLAHQIRVCDRARGPGPHRPDRRGRLPDRRYLDALNRRAVSIPERLEVSIPKGRAFSDHPHASGLCRSTYQMLRYGRARGSQDRQHERLGAPPSINRATTCARRRDPRAMLRFEVLGVHARNGTVRFCGCS